MRDGRPGRHGILLLPFWTAGVGNQVELHVGTDRTGHNARFLAVDAVGPAQISRKQRILPFRTSVTRESVWLCFLGKPAAIAPSLVRLLVRHSVGERTGDGTDELRIGMLDRIQCVHPGGSRERKKKSLRVGASRAGTCPYVGEY
ncbi:hypothetical protein GGS23DRAFT_546296 [Durotheca rogersii]|uniref:uncharacterized protein n=1 Tax=Durotheca rogersii TaxID=419775 RepID=UPI002220E868|nr:uncharacterized protein GGS23DRAFT_546296 [Durotheca rogersii]KAI5868586.1 hypothetical protein GGS23DRAFT_546296 [Durotheca rogersii]